MNQFKLNLGAFAQGTLGLKPINIAFVFQVNCPGCFIYGIPTMNQLYQKFKEEVGFIGISTAFEDFEYNTLANTKRLLNEGITVGETNKYLLGQGSATYEQLPKFPIAFDKISSPEDFLKEKNLTSLTNTLAGARTLSPAEETMLHQNIKHHYQKYPAIAETFTLNQLRGTPSFIVFKDNFEVIAHSFGHQSIQSLEQLLSNSY